VRRSLDFGPRVLVPFKGCGVMLGFVLLERSV
jgi:hypothetical protein